jgi:uncharacterized protein YjiS (DUF1127 family)
MPRRKRITANEMIRNGGLMNFRRALRHAARYGTACREAGHLLTLDEYRDWMGLSRSQAFREQQAWRACCGELSVLEVVSTEALESKGFTEDEREETIARELAGG